MTSTAVLASRVETLSTQLQRRNAEITIMRDGFIELSIDPDFLHPQLSAIQHGMKRITDNPTFRDVFPFQIHETDCYGSRYSLEVGLKERNDRERKCWFQFTPKAYLRPTAEQEKVDMFLRSLARLDARAMECAIAVAERFDEYNQRKSTLRKYPGKMADRTRRGRCITRVLRYLSNGMRAAAYPHVDRSVFSIHWGASHKGLVIFGPDGERSQIDEMSASSIAIFPGEKFAAITRGRFDLLGTPHGVRYERVADEDRYAFVSFVHPEALSDDAAWLAEHRGEIEAYERSLAL